jgi:hypothetical protein
MRWLGRLDLGPADDVRIVIEPCAALLDHAAVQAVWARLGQSSCWAAPGQFAYDPVLAALSRRVEQEQELLLLREEKREFPESVKTESEKAAVLAAKAAEQKFEQEILLLKKESETEKRLASLQVKTLEDTIARQAAQIEALQKQVEEAKQQVQDIAVKAIEGASGARALAHINQIAMEQAKRPQQ